MDHPSAKDSFVSRPYIKKNIVKDLLLKETNIFNGIEEFCIKNSLIIPKQDNYEKFNVSIIFELLRYEYVIFLTNKYFTFFKKSLLEFFKKCNILCLNYYDKVHIQRGIELFNFWIRSSEDNITKDQIILKYKLRKLKKFYFFENMIEPNILYKKIIFSNEELFISFDKYSIKKIEYKLKAFSQIAEKMGAIKIEIIYDKEIYEKNNFETTLNGNEVGAGLSKTNINESSEQIKLGFDYSSDSYNFNLNKFDLVDTINKENVFFISKEEFESDIDLNFLIDARCINLIKEYNTELIFKYANEWEKKIFLYALKFNLVLNSNGSKKNDTNIKIKIIFLNIYMHFKDITGGNMYCLKEGFFHLSNLILNNPKSEWAYLKIANFLYSHLYYLQKNKFKINVQYNNLDLIKTFEDIIELNFTKDELSKLFEEFFQQNLNYEQFKHMREIIIKQVSNFYDIIERHSYYGIEKKNIYLSKEITFTNKLLYISYQYHIIKTYKLNLLNKIKVHIDYIFSEINNLKMFSDYKDSLYFKQPIIKSQINILNSSTDITYLLLKKYPKFNLEMDNPIKKMINPLLHELLSYIKKRGYIIKLTNEHILVLKLIKSLCFYAKKYNTIIFKNNSKNFIYNNFIKYATKYIYFLPHHFLDYETDAEIGNIDIDISKNIIELNNDETFTDSYCENKSLTDDNNDNDNDNDIDNDDDIDNDIDNDDDIDITVDDNDNERLTEHVYNYNYDDNNSCKSDLSEDKETNISELSKNSFIDNMYRKILKTNEYLDLFKLYYDRHILFNLNNDIDLLPNLINIFTPNLSDYYNEESIKNTIYQNILYYNDYDYDYEELENLIKYCFNRSFNINNGLFDYICKNKKYDLAKYKLTKILNEVIVNRSYEEKSNYNIIAQLLIPLIVYRLNPNDFEFDLENSDRTKISLIKKVNNFMLKLIKNYNQANNFNFDISNYDFEKYSKIIHLNYLKYRIFYTVDNFQELIYFNKNSEIISTIAEHDYNDKILTISKYNSNN